MDKYHRILLKKVEDARLLKWLEAGRRVGERPSRAIRRKLYELYEGRKK